MRQKQLQNRLGEGDIPIFPRGLGKIGTVPGGFETKSKIQAMGGAHMRDRLRRLVDPLGEQFVEP